MNKSKIIYSLKIAFYIFLFFLIIELLLRCQTLFALNHNITPLEAFLPRPSSVLTSLYVNFSLIIEELLYTFSRSIIGLSFGLMLALIMAYLTFVSSKISSILDPVLHAVNAFPVIGFAPLIILTFGQGSDLGIIFLSMLIAYFPIYISVQHAIRNIPEGIKDIGKVLKITKKQDFLYIRLSEIRSALISSLKLAFPASIVGAIIGEWLGTNHGIGQLITISLYRFQPEILYASLLTIVLLNLFALKIIKKIEKHFLPSR